MTEQFKAKIQFLIFRRRADDGGSIQKVGEKIVNGENGEMGQIYLRSY
jgi:hypothetical protein